MRKFASTAQARLATRLAFFAAGFAMASCAPLFPFIKQNVAADERQFGLLLLCFEPFDKVITNEIEFDIQPSCD